MGLLFALVGASAPGVWAAGFEGSGAGSQLTKAAPETTTTATTATTPTTETTNSKSTILIAGIAAVLLLSGIAFVIVRDARRVAPATADLMAKMANGLASDLATAVLLATDAAWRRRPPMNSPKATRAATRRLRCASAARKPRRRANSANARAEHRRSQPLSVI